jgi:hypothetical protein
LIAGLRRAGLDLADLGRAPLAEILDGVGYHEAGADDDPAQVHINLYMDSHLIATTRLRRLALDGGAPGLDPLDELRRIPGSLCCAGAFSVLLSRLSPAELHELAAEIRAGGIVEFTSLASIFGAARACDTGLLNETDRAAVQATSLAVKQYLARIFGAASGGWVRWFLRLVLATVIRVSAGMGARFFLAPVDVEQLLVYQTAMDEEDEPRRGTPFSRALLDGGGAPVLLGPGEAATHLLAFDWRDGRLSGIEVCEDKAVAAILCAALHERFRHRASSILRSFAQRVDEAPA